MQCIAKSNRAGKAARSILSVLLFLGLLFNCVPLALALDERLEIDERLKITVEGGTLREAYARTRGAVYVIEVEEEAEHLSITTNATDYVFNAEYTADTLVPGKKDYAYQRLDTLISEDKKTFTISSLDKLPIVSAETYSSYLGTRNSDLMTELDPWTSGDFYVIIAGYESDYSYLDYLIIKKSGEETDKSTLGERLNAVPKEGYHTENDRWNGKVTSKSGFWSEMQVAVSKAQAIYEREGVTQKAVDGAVSALQKTIANLIPTSQVNATALYEALQTDWRWLRDGESNDLEDAAADPAYGGRVEISSENCTAITWTLYTKAKEEAQALLDSLYDENGEPTEANTADKQAEVDRLAAALAPSELVNAKYYTKLYQTYIGLRDEANSLLDLYDPAKLTEGAYSDASWKAYTAAYTALKNDMTHKVEGGSRADLEMMEYVSTHVAALKTVRKQLESTTDITISFTYVNSFAAKYPAIRDSGTDLYVNEALKLTGGHCTLNDAVTAAGITFDKKSISGLPMGWNDSSDTRPSLAVYVNGESYGTISQLVLGNPDKTIQLHDGDQVRVTRIPTLVSESEASSGYDSTTIIPSQSLHPEEYQHSFALIHLTAPDGGVKVGDKANFSAALTGADVTNFGQELDPKGITLFVSDPSETEAFSQPTTQTTAVTDGSGALEYVFTQPGWYTVAAINVADDVPTFTDVFNSVTLGTYPSLYAGDCALVYVEEVEDEEALIVQYKAEFSAKADDYFGGFHDYDFPEGYYENTFKAKYQELKANLDSAETFKTLKEGFDTDFAALQAAAGQAINHQAVMDGLRSKMNQLPNDLSTLDESYQTLVDEIKAAYDGLNDHQRTLLSPQEVKRLEEIKTAECKLLAKVTFTVTVEGTALPDGSDVNGTGGVVTMGYPNMTWSMHPQPNGTIPNPDWRDNISYPSTPQGVSSPISAKAGDHLFVRRYLETTDDLYWMMWSVDGQTWQPSVRQTLTDSYGTSYDWYYMAEYVVPQDIEDGSVLNIALKMLSKADYDAYVQEQDAAGLGAVKDAAMAAIQAAYDSYDKSQYDAGGKTALEKALTDGKTAIEKAATSAAVTDARKAALAAMAAVGRISSGTSTGRPVTYDSGAAVGQVHVIIENTTYADGPFYGAGKIANGWYTLGENDTMMTVVLKALQSRGYSWNGTTDFGDDQQADYSITYLSSIVKDGKVLAEFTGGQKSGWMGTLNEWFTNEGFHAFSVANGKLENNDEIHIMYTCAYGEDINGTWRDNNNTTLNELTVSGGTLTPSFSGDVTDYMLIISGDRVNVKVKPVPTNKNYQHRIFLNDYDKDSAMYKRTETISVTSGDTIYVGVGEQGWPTMNTGGSPTKYTIQVYSLEEALAALPDSEAVNSRNYATYQDTVTNLEKLVRQQGYQGDTSRLTALKERVEFFAQIDKVKALLDAVPEADKLTLKDKSKVTSARNAYNALSEEQKEYITISDVIKYNAAVEWLEQQGISTGGSITGSNKAPEEDLTAKVEVKKNKDGTTIAEVTLPKDADRGMVSFSITEADKGNVLAILAEDGTVAAIVKKSVVEGDMVHAVVNRSCTVKVVDNTKTFEDTIDHWARDTVEFAASHELFNGTGATTFRPDLPMDRAMLATVLYRLESAAAEGENPFHDVAEGTWYTDGVIWASAEGIVLGYGNGAFGPADPITREQMAVMLYRYAKFLGMDTTVKGDVTKFSDADEVSDWADEAMTWAVGAGLINGKTSDTLAPADTATRAEVATVMQRLVKLMVA